MKLKHFLSLAVMTAFGASSAWGQISTMPYSTDFSSENPFDGGSVVDGTNVQSVLNVNNTSTAAEFLIDGENPYVLSENEEVTVSFTAFHGWLTNGKDQSVSLVNSDGVVLAGYTYNLGSCNLTNVTVGGGAASLTPYNIQSKASAKNANGLDNGKAQGYVTTDGNNPIITFTVAQSGRCVVNVKKGAANIDNTYAGNVEEGVKMDIAKIVITCGSNNGDRTICIDDLSVSSIINTSKKADFTIQYVDENGYVIKEETTGNADVNSTPVLGATDKETFVSGDYKYVYSSDDAAECTIASDGSTVVTVKFATLGKYNYSVTSNLGATIAEGSAFEDETPFVAWSKCVDVDGAMYATEAPYSTSVTVENPNIVVDYNPSNILYFFEAESILSRSYGNPNGDYSGGTSAAIYTGAELAMSDIAAGSYTITVSSSVRRANDDVLNILISTDGENWEEAGSITLTSNTGGDYSADVVLPAEGSIRLVEGKSQNFCHYVDYVVITEYQSADESAADINGDGEVNVADAVALITEIIAGNTDSKYDIDGNGTVDTKDAEEIINIYLKNK